VNIAILTDYPVVTFACGPSLSTQALKRYMENRGHTVTIVGPQPGKDDPVAVPGSLLLSSVTFKAHPGVQMPFAWPPSAFDNAQKFDVIHSHANSLLMHWAPMMREMHGIPCLSTNTIYLPGFAQHLLPNKIYQIETIRNAWAKLAPKVEASFAKAYNGGDGLIVQCQALADYWKEFGLDVPLHTIPRPIDVAIFDQPLGPDPFKPEFPKGGRVIVVCRHAREKDIDKVIQVFASHVLPRLPDASLTLVGDGLEHKALVKQAERLGIANRCDFPGERPQRDLRHYYGHADVFAYASQTETYGQVISEALWCGVPVVAVDDKMGVAFQVRDGYDGVLVPGGQGEYDRLGDALHRMLANADERAAFGKRAAVRARERVAPDVVYAQYEAAYASAQEHIKQHPPVRFNNRSPVAWARMVNRHLFPWWTLQGMLVTLAGLRGAKGDYKLPIGFGLEKLPSSPTTEGALR
jgi:1,2-diacylglycerol 3-alpha-glucosyltransferase